MASSYLSFIHYAVSHPLTGAAHPGFLAEQRVSGSQVNDIFAYDHKAAWYFPAQEELSRQRRSHDVAGIVSLIVREAAEDR